jgi:hypothetical protein
MGEKRITYTIFVGKPRPEWEDNIKWILKKYDGWILLDSLGSGWGLLAGFY